MEIDLSGFKKDKWALTRMALMLLLALILIGRAFTPEGGRMLSWQEWQIRKLQKAQRVEQAQLLKDANRLAELLADEADPARVQVVVQGVRRDISKGTVETLADERQKVADAAQAVLDWAIGIKDYNAAVDAVQRALEAMGDGG